MCVSLNPCFTNKSVHTLVFGLKQNIAADNFNFAGFSASQTVSTFH